MKCPYCDKEMQNGYVPTDTTPAQWLPDGKKQSLIKTKYSKECKKITSKSTILGIHAKANYCEDYGIILLKEEK